MATPTRGEIWMADLDPTKGHEPRGQRPILIVSSNEFNKGRSTFVFALPITRTNRRIPAHIEVTPPEGGLTSTSYVLCDALRSISKDRLGKQALGSLSLEKLAEVEEILKLLLDLE